MLVKICGLREASHLGAAHAAGADLIGLVFATSRRQISLAAAEAMVAELAAMALPRPQVAGLFVNAEPALVRAHVAALNLDYVQLSGDEGPEWLEELSTPLLVAVRFDGSAREAGWRAAAAAQPERVRLLVDAHQPGHYGGTGSKADWQRAAELAREMPIMLAGGLTPTNVGAAIATVRPWAVDVSSGVERDGRKDPALIAAFVAAAREAYDAE